MKYPVFLDIEASGLSDRSYPVEIAWNNGDGKVSSFLINVALVPGWTHWDPNAEKLHGISRKTLEEDGVDPDAACHVLLTELKGKTVYSDASEFDQFWLDRLFDAHGGAPSPVRVRDMCGIGAIRFAAVRGVASEMKEKAVAEVGGEHRAKNDVRALMRFYEMAAEEFR
jgi:hypothetical protein